MGWVVVVRLWFRRVFGWLRVFVWIRVCWVVCGVNSVVHWYTILLFVFKLVVELLV